MSKFKMPSSESFRKNIESSGLPQKQKRDALRVLDYSLAHPSSLAEKQEQAKRAELERERLRRK